MAEQYILSDAEIEPWSNARCISISRKDAFPAKVKDLAVQKGIINRFLNFYLTGKTQKGLTASDLIFAVISIIPITLHTEQLIWYDSNYSDDGSLFYLTPEDRLKREICNILNEQNESNETCATEIVTKNEKISGKEEIQQKNDINEYTNPIDEESPKPAMAFKIIWYSNKIEKQDNKSKPTSIQEYGPVENAAFCRSCNKLLDLWESDEKARIYLKYFFGFAALTLMRTITKSYQKVIEVFSKKFSDITYFSQHKIAYSTPNDICIKKSYKSLRKLEENTQIMFAKLVVNSLTLPQKLVQQSIPNTGGVLNMFNATVLTHSADYGLNLISMLQVVATRTCHFELLFETLYSEETAIFWNRLRNFFKSYMSTLSHHVTCHWARIIERDQFNKLTCERNYNLAVVIAVFIEKMTEDSGVWKSNWVKSGRDLDVWKKLGEKMFEDFTLKGQRELNKMFYSEHVKLI